MLGRERRRYLDRHDAGQVLAEALEHWAGRSDVVVLALPRGGLPVAGPVAARLNAPLGVIVVRKVGVPGRPELAMGALASVGDRIEVFRNWSVLQSVGVGDAGFDAVARRETVELQRRLQNLGGRKITIESRVVIVVDDGLATGSTMRAAVAAARRQRPASIVVAVPVGAVEAVASLSEVADHVVCVWTPQRFLAVGAAYRDFTQTTDQQAQEVLNRAAP